MIFTDGRRTIASAGVSRPGDDQPDVCDVCGAAVAMHLDPRVDARCQLMSKTEDEAWAVLAHAHD